MHELVRQTGQGRPKIELSVKVDSLIFTDIESFSKAVDFENVVAPDDHHRAIWVSSWLGSDIMYSNLLLDQIVLPDNDRPRLGDYLTREGDDKLDLVFFLSA